jgi:hypothetical protein
MPSKGLVSPENSIKSANSVVIAVQQQLHAFSFSGKRMIKIFMCLAITTLIMLSYSGASSPVSEPTAYSKRVSPPFARFEMRATVKREINVIRSELNKQNDAARMVVSESRLEVEEFIKKILAAWKNSIGKFAQLFEGKMKRFSSHFTKGKSERKVVQ